MKTNPPSTPARAGARRRILAAAEELLVREGPQSLSIRGVSERCGYSAPTIYHHFGDKEGLTRAVVEVGFARLLEQLRALGAGDDGSEHLRSLVRTFIEFGLHNPQYYALFSTLHVESSPPPPSVESARALLEGALLARSRDGGLRQADLDGVFQAVWALLHGLISLRVRRPHFPWSPRQVEVALEMVEHGLACCRKRREGPAAEVSS
ncbi:MAG: TetR/AcrR family transcriptional regulator [Myxococcota bacterium]